MHSRSLLLPSLALMGLLACGGGGSSSTSTPGTSTPPATPNIASFTAASAVLEAGAGTQLTATFSGGTGSVDQGVGAVTSGVAVAVKPARTTLYTLTVTDGAGHSSTYPLLVGVKKVPFELVSLAEDGHAANSQSYLNEHTISADGRYVCFASMDATLVAGDTNGQIDIFVRDRVANTTTLVSRASDGTLANGYSDHPRLSADGRFVVFESHATNLVAGLSPGNPQIYRHDLQTHQTQVVSVDSSGALKAGYSESPSLSADGRFVVFASSASLTAEYNTGGSVYLRDMDQGSTALLSRKANGTICSGFQPIISGDGAQVFYESLGDPLGLGATAWQLYRVDRASGATTLASCSASGAPREQGNESSSRVIHASASRDGRFVTFSTTAGNLVPGTTGGVQNVFVKDTASGQIALLSQSASGASGNADSVMSQGGRAPISGNGTWVSYNTQATNLIGGQGSSMVVDIFAGTTRVVQAGGGFVGDTNPFLSPDADGRFLLLRAQEPLDPRSTSRGLFLVDRHAAPVAVSGPLQTVSAGAAVTLDGSGSSVSPNDFPSPAPALTHRWTQLSGPATVTLSSATAAKPTFTAGAAGLYVFQLSVNDTVEDSLPVLAYVVAR